MQISIDSGKKEIEIIRDGKKAGSIWFSPGDPALLGRLKDVRGKAEAIQASMRVSEADGLEAALEEAQRVDAEIRAVLDWAFDSPVSDVVFGDSYSFTTSEGVSALEQFLQGATAYISEAMEREAAEAQAHRQKYLAKYQQ